MEKAGFVAQKVSVIANQRTPANAPDAYKGLMPTSDRLSLDFRFRSGSSELDTKAADDIKRVANALASDLRDREVVLVGLADNTGSPAANVTLSKQRAQAVADHMKSQGITPALITGFGAAMAIADNSTGEGREKNRRVEIWLRR